MSTLYHWRSVALQNYQWGDIVVVAYSVDEARAKALADVERFVRTGGSPIGYLFDRNSGSPVLADEDDQERLDKFLKTFHDDLAKEPEVVTSGVFYREGGE